MKTYHHPFIQLLLLVAPLALPASAKDARPNILFIFSDDHSKNAIGCYGNTDIETPGLDRIVAEGMRFERALTPNSFRTPSRAVVLTGRYSHKNGVTRLNQKFDGSQQTFPKLLQATGYQTGLFGKWHLLSQPTGFDHYCVMKMQGMAFDPRVYEPQHEWIAWGSDTRKEAREGGRVIKGYNNDVLTDEALNWLDKQQGAKGEKNPFCLLIHPKPPHEPYSPPKKYEDFLEDVVIPEPKTLHDDYRGRAPEAIADRMTANRILLKSKYRKMVPADRRLQKMSERELLSHLYQIYIKGYYRLVKSVDDNVAKVLDYLDQTGLAENTLVIYSSDQGFALGEHGFYNKKWMYEPSLHQPLLVRFPDVVKPRSVHRSMVSHVDLAPTLLDFAGQAIPSDMQGHSLKPILEGSRDKVRDSSYYHFYEHGKALPEMIGIRADTHKLIHYPGLPKSHQWELFDLENDPDEMANLYGNPEHNKTREDLQDDLRTLIKEVDDPVDAPALMDDRTTAKSAEVNPARPNIVFIYADDMGYGDCGVYNPGISIPTPHIDRLAKEGLRFTDAHAPHATCTGSRYGFLTGTSPSRTGVKNTLTRLGSVIDRKEATLARLLKEQGYKTRMVGKWHLGFDLPAGKSKKSIDADTTLQAGPMDCGFDYFLGNIAGLSEFPIRARNQVAEPVDINTQNRVFCEDVIRLLKQHAATDGSKPLFLYYALHEPHKPQIPEQRFVGKSAAGAYGDYLIQMDHWVGEVVKTLRETGLEENTLVIFASDNGASKANAATCPGHTPNSSLSGFKAMPLEGGHRVPPIMKWPGKIPQNTVTSALVNHTDFFATFAELLEVDHAKRYHGSAKDSYSFLTVLSDPSAAQQRPPMVVVGSYRKGSWKLIADGHRGIGEDAKATALYDIENDVSEKTNLVQSEPDKTKTLLAEYREFLLARDLKKMTKAKKEIAPAASE